VTKVKEFCPFYIIAHAKPLSRKEFQSKQYKITWRLCVFA